jgi:hypothetical protein
MKKHLAWRKIAVIFLLWAFSTIDAIAQKSSNPYPGLLDSPINNHTVIRFYYHPNASDRLVYPLVLAVSDNENEKSIASSLQVEGMTAFISTSEMKGLVEEIAKSVPMPQQTRHHEVLGAWEFLQSQDSMDVVILFSEGAARGKIPSKDICIRLAALNIQVTASQANQAFVNFRKLLGCQLVRP